ncbi:MAG: pentapeptide repeat-containing protein [Prochlorotrichaceae cyanobacterium]|jgi:hypothetical protein
MGRFFGDRLSGLTSVIFGVVGCLFLLWNWTLPALAISPAEGIDSDLRLNLVTKDFSGQVLIDRRFTKVELGGANFEQADLRGTVFNGTDLTGANLHAINFENGMAYHTVLRNADLSDAILVNTFLLQSQFDGANVTNADFKDSVLDLQEQIKLCKTATGKNPITGRDTRKTLGCS